MSTRRSFLLPPRATTTGRLLAEAAAWRGMDVRTVPAEPIPADLRGRAHLYGGERFADAMASALDVALLEPPLDLLPALPAYFTGRHVELITLGQARRHRVPRFVKPAAGKLFSAGVRPDGTGLPTHLPAELPVLSAEPVAFAEEYRLHVLDGEVRAASRYALSGVLDSAPLPPRHPALGFGAELMDHLVGGLPGAVVVDIGILSDSGRFAVVEANEAWFSNSYAADADRVLDVVLRAAGPGHDVRDTDRRFVRRTAGCVTTA
ncbi:ATP-grasp domain-containing protein [Actinoallomurus purpureus]|uniref:ATP-grasp domain-containing protein n=1 Tax=Actinoallomurus purpureus TaxID=478114 RepID=UPI0020924830|nr:ATP-grasp domain-containing protein [Actinoallomurus purpureus]MCO6003379.1 ATP-grasp domain-containing protein [Actinoallomurus purpureus]